MDVARPEFKIQKRRRQTIWSAVGVALLGTVTIGVSRLKPAAPEVDRSTVWTDTVKRGQMVRQVRGQGSLIPSQEFTRQIPAETEVTVVRILQLPGSLVKADTILVEMSNPQVEQAAVDAKLQLKAAESEYQNLKVTLESNLMNQKADAATVNADYTEAKLHSDSDKTLYDSGVISRLAYDDSKNKADELTTRNNIETARLEINQKAIESQLAQEQAKVDEMRTLAELKQKQLDALQVRGGIDGVLVDLPLEVGQHLMPGAMVAKVVQPNHLIAELKVAETQARDIQIGLPAVIDTHNGTVAGTVMREDPSVQNGTVTVDVRLSGELQRARGRT
jgi:HlyD family secretion protein